MNTDKDLLEKVFVITGGNSGIGFVSACNFARRGATVLLLCRNQSRGEAAVEAIRTRTGNDKVHLYLADFSLLASVASTASRFR